MQNLCSACPRACNADRASASGVCGATNTITISRAALHMWEEPCISGTHGSGAVFFCGCNLHCVFCQNKKISQRDASGIAVSPQRLREIYFSLIEKGAHNINLVTPTHFTYEILPSLTPALPVPVVWNSSAYENTEALKHLENKVQIYLPDLKYGLREPAQKYSGASDYPVIAQNAILEMFRQRGKYQIENGILKSGVVIRHLLLPENIKNTFAVLEWVAKTFKKGDVLFSLMSQYTPMPGVFPELSRPISSKEYIVARNYMLKLGISDGFVQQLSSSDTQFIPDFDDHGVI